MLNERYEKQFGAYGGQIVSGKKTWELELRKDKKAMHVREWHLKENAAAKS